jgi:hypothetical protein
MARMDQQAARFGWPYILLAVALAAHAVLIGSLFFGYLDPLFHDSDRFPRGIDFYSVYQAGDAALHGRSIYAFPNTADVPYSLPYRYLPFVAYGAALPMQILPAKAAYWLWVGAIELMVGWNARTSFHLASDRKWACVGAAFWLCATPLYLETYMGQWSLLMATLVMTAMAYLLRRNDVSALSLWGTSVLTKTNSAILWPMFARIGQWRAVLIVGGIVVLFSAPYFIARPDDWRIFWEMNFGYYWDEPPTFLAAVESGNLGLAGLTTAAWLVIDENATTTPIGLAAPIIVAVLALSLAATVAWRQPSIAVLFAVWMTSYFLLYGDVWEHHYVMLLPVLALLIGRIPEFRPLALVVFVFVALPTPYALFERLYADDTFGVTQSAELLWPHWAGILYHCSKIVPTAALWLAACAYCLGLWSPRAQTDASE